MSKFLRIVWAWCLAMALPLQGYAAQAMPCVPAIPVGSAIAAQLERAAQAAAATAEADCHGAAGISARCPLGDSAAQDHGSQACHCSAGASCCGALAIMGGLVSIPLVPPGRLEVPTVPVIRDRVMVSGLERPPRSATR
ncbi:hypothetical protein QRD43_22465 [Pelomonas sp. APW6]|uniref:CopL family metal-binding regulatory protein n=1 Tax=Roseateles subflavus TaxID=3053353 RepID=A0ABT7LP77_9BURK|nr:hypothetical protein [Pelomonas sp. APW6]MDL5034684.1 hypothetical protein [Pelomonas sp. APW6]